MLPANCRPAPPRTVGLDRSLSGNSQDSRISRSRPCGLFRAALAAIRKRTAEHNAVMRRSTRSVRWFASPLLLESKKTRTPNGVLAFFLVSPRGVTQFAACKLPSSASPYGRLGPLAIRESTGFPGLTLAPLRVRLPQASLDTNRKTAPLWMLFFYWYRLGESNP